MVSRYPGNEAALALAAVNSDQPTGYILFALMRRLAMSDVLAIIDEICAAEPQREEGIGQRLIEELRSGPSATVKDPSTIRAQGDHEDETAKAFWTTLSLEHHLLEFNDYLE